MKIIDGQKIATKIKNKIVKETYQIANSASSRRPNLAIILVGNRADSQLYVSLKEREGVKLGIDTNLYKLEENVSEAELLNLIGFLNRDELIDGILVQLPLPEKFATDKIIKAINPLKDADGFHPLHPEYVISPVLGAILETLKYIKFSATGKIASVLYNSEIFGSSVGKILEELGLQVNLVSVKNFNSLDENEAELKRQEIKLKCQAADLLISALGLPRFINSEIVKPEAVLIDIGITKINGQVLGDFDFDNLKSIASYITPVPGGVGPMTIALLFRNVLEIFKHRS
ncbi:MAG: bifunctional 5,10-methylenetetrahydrofolate dehydrogenase/5,10-methenyltetrahydrofolate cyclohydrolase [Candidatus Falkowbacteria bacterium]|nr:bifunctional 5,10-methylenetetrahydrofolate dehydrogenase/5,10-methenyltetrahydrofolate cyclohydrolase [Candidatus Falkowbacteria bacterium]